MDPLIYSNGGTTTITMHGTGGLYRELDLSAVTDFSGKKITSIRIYYHQQNYTGIWKFRFTGAATWQQDYEKNVAPFGVLNAWTFTTLDVDIDVGDVATDGLFFGCYATSNGYLRGTSSSPFQPNLEIRGIEVDVIDLATLAATSIEKYSARLNGEIIAIGSANATARGFVYDTATHGDPGDTAPSASDYAEFTTSSGSFGAGTFNTDVTDLAHTTTHYFRAWAEDSDGFHYGDELNFTTLTPEYAISGIVKLNGTPVENAIVRCIRESDNVALAAQTTDENGVYIFEEMDENETFHIAVEYEVGGVKYNARSQWGIVPAET